METGNELAKNKSFLQFGKFFIVGVLNTAIDFAILNLLMWLTNTYEGGNVAIFNTISFTVAVINSYILNKYWTFSAKGEAAPAGENKDASKASTEFVKFFIVAVTGWLLNTGILFGITTYVHPLFGASAALWANIAKAIATGIVLTWNFIGYKFLVFKK